MLANFTPRIMKRFCSCLREIARLYDDIHYSAMQHIPLDEYVIDVLLPDLTRHDRAPGAFLVYVVLWTALFRSEQRRVALSLRQMAESAGLSKSSVQAAIRLLRRRDLIRV